MLSVVSSNRKRFPKRSFSETDFALSNNYKTIRFPNKRLKISDGTYGTTDISDYFVSYDSHPLAKYCSLTDIQCCITDAIVAGNKHHCHIDHIVDFVIQRWSLLKQPNGQPLPRDSDKRATILHYLDNSDSNWDLFEQTQRSYWRCVTSLRRSEETRAIPNSLYNGKRSTSSSETASEGEESWDDMDVAVLYERIKDSKLTTLQVLISISILRNPQGEEKIDKILSFVSQQIDCFSSKENMPKASDPKRAVLASLSKNASTSPLFLKGNEEGTWKIGPKNVLTGFKTEPEGLLDFLIESKQSNDSSELTELQKMIIRAISLQPGPCSLELICDYVRPRYESLKRRDGSSYANNARRAIQASLSNNSSNRPIFEVLEDDSGEQEWKLSDRGIEYLQLIKAEEKAN